MGLRFEDLTLHYQPQVSSDGTRMVAVEALLRVLRPAPRLASPADVLAELDSPDQAEALDLWVVDRACADARRWPTLPVAVNLTADRFRDPCFPDKLKAILEEHGVRPEQIELEIVESSYIGDFEAAMTTISALRADGFRIAVDDFGTGYSSLSYLLRLPMDKLKIDRCFVENVSTLRSAAIVQAVVALARALGIKVTAEGVETAEQWRILKASGCHYLQGWLFSKALPPEEIDRLFAEGRGFPLKAAS